MCRGVLTRVVEGREDISYTRAVLDQIEQKLEHLSDDRNKDQLSADRLAEFKVCGIGVKKALPA